MVLIVLHVSGLQTRTGFFVMVFCDGRKNPRNENLIKSPKEPIDRLNSEPKSLHLAMTLDL